MLHRRSVAIASPAHPVLKGMALGALIALAGCQDGLSPTAVNGTYVLERVGDDPIPAIVLREGSAALRILADTLRLHPGGRGTFVSVSVIELPTAGPLPPVPVRLERELGWRVVRSSVEITFDCPPNADCAPGPHLVGHRTANGLVIEQTLFAVARLTYRKIPRFLLAD